MIKILLVCSLMYWIVHGGRCCLVLFLFETTIKHHHFRQPERFCCEFSSLGIQLLPVKQIKILENQNVRDFNAS